MESQMINFSKKTKETKNKVVYTDEADFGPLYVPKSFFNGTIPDAISVEIKWG